MKFLSESSHMKTLVISIVACTSDLVKIRYTFTFEPNSHWNLWPLISRERSTWHVPKNEAKNKILTTLKYWGREVLFIRVFALVSSMKQITGQTIKAETRVLRPHIDNNTWWVNLLNKTRKQEDPLNKCTSQVWISRIVENFASPESFSTTLLFMKTQPLEFIFKFISFSHLSRWTEARI